MKQTQTPSTIGQKRRGRPRKYTRKTERVICDAVADGVPLKHAAAIAGVAEATLHDWKRTIPTFLESIEAAIARGIHSRLKVIKKASDRGDVRAASWYLEHVHPTHFAKSRVDVLHAVASEGALLTSDGEVNLDTAVQELSPTALRAILDDILSGRATKFQGKFAPPIIDLPAGTTHEKSIAMPENPSTGTSKLLHA